MAQHALSDALLNALEIRPNTAPNHMLTALSWAHPQPEGAPPANELPGVRALFRFSSWGPVPKFAECAARQRDWNFNTDGFRFAENRDRDDPEFAEVLLVDYFDEAEVSHSAFDRLCARAFDALIAFAATRAPEVKSQAWWPEFLEHAAAVKGRVGSR